MIFTIFMAINYIKFNILFIFDLSDKVNDLSDKTILKNKL